MSPNRNDPCPCGSGRKYKHCCLIRGQVEKRLSEQRAPEADDAAVMKVAAGHLQAGRLDQTAHICAQILQARPDHVQSNHLMGLVAWRTGRLDEAAGFLLRALRGQPRNVNLHANLAGILGDMGMPADALRAYETALQLQPDAVDLHYGIGNQLLALGDDQAAVESFRKVLAERPEHGPAHNNLAVALMRQGLLDEAEHHVREADRLAPANGAPQLTLGSLMVLRGRLGESIAAFRQVLRRNPRYGEAHLEMGSVLLRLGRHEDAVSHWRSFLDMQPTDAARAAQALIGLHADPHLDDAGWLAEHARWAGLPGVSGRLGDSRPPVVDPDPDRPLKVACLLPDPRTADARCRVLPLLRALSLLGEVHVYGAAAEAGDESCDSLHWHGAPGEDEAAFARRLHEDGVDVVLDVMGHLGVRYGAGFVQTLLRRPVPLLVSWGYPGSMGIPGLYDAILADETLIPPGAEAFYAETVVRLPGQAVLWCDEGTSVPRRAEDDGAPVFGSLQGPEALPDMCLDLWMRVMEAQPAARLLLAHPDWAVAEVADAVRERLSRRGLAPERLAFARDGQNALEGMDVVLDAPGLSAGYLLATALLSGVPALSLEGGGYRGRLGAACLRAAGCDDWVVQDPDGYVRLAAALLEDRTRLEVLRRELPERVARSGLGGAASLAHGIDAELRRLWQCV